MKNDNLVVNSLRFLSVEAVQKANSGHPGLPMGAAPMAYALWGKNLNINPKDSKWLNRDRFILSAGHGSALNYSLLHMYGFDVSIDDLKEFRQLHSNTPGHPEIGLTHGVEAATGPLGQGISMAVGMAIAETHLAEEFNKPDLNLIDHYTYVIASDGDLMEGISYEACSLAGTLGLGKLIVLYDSNSISIEGDTDQHFTEDVVTRFEGFHWQVLEVEDGNNIKEINKAIKEAKEDTKRPTLIKITTQIGYGSPAKVGTASAHGEPLGADNIVEMREYLEWNYDSFHVPHEAYEKTQSQLAKKKEVYDEWKELESAYAESYPTEYKKLMDTVEGKLPDDLFDESYFDFDKDYASRESSGIVLNRIADKFEALLGGSADLAPSNKTEIKNSTWYDKNNYGGRNFHFGVREHAMAAIGNGMALHGGLRPYVATFLIFSDYMKGAMRLSSVMKTPLIYVLTHDSIGVGEDGPTHQPIEQLSMLRTIPNFHVFRPADSTETAYAWKVAMESKETPVALALSRQKLPNLAGSSENTEKGGYIIAEAQNPMQLILMGSGSEVSLCLEAKNKLEDKGIGVRVVSMPCMTLFDQQDEEYKQSVLPNEMRKRISIEAAATLPWYKYVGLDGITIGLDRFGESAPAAKVYEYLNITTDRILEEAKTIIDMD